MTRLKDKFKICEIELKYHHKCKASERPNVQSTDEAYNLFMNTWDRGKIELQEQFRVLLLDKKLSCIGVSTVASGGIASCTVDLKLVFALAIKSASSAIVLAHNHPSGSKKPSSHDRILTGQFTQAGKLLGIDVLDHLIITPEGYTSMASEGLMNCKM